MGQGSKTYGGLSYPRSDTSQVLQLSYKVTQLPNQLVVWASELGG